MSHLDKAEHQTDLYFVACGEFIKVGIAADTSRRVQGLQLGCPYPLRLAYRRAIPGGLERQVEKLVHERLKPFAIGREWFSVTPEEALAAALPIIQAAANHARRRGRGSGTITGRGPTTKTKVFEIQGQYLSLIHI